MTHALKRPVRVLASAAILAGSLLAAPSWAADLDVEVNQSRLHKLAQTASTIIVGNPSIADVSISNSNTLVVFGRSFGKTNLIALNERGQQIANFDVNVVATQSNAVTLNRGAGQYSYNCTPRCARVIMTTDATEATDTLLATTKSVTGYADQTATKD